MTAFRLTRISLILAYRPKKILEGVLEDVPMKIGECLIPTDFVVLAYDEEPKDPLIMVRSFLATAGAGIDVKRGGIALNVCVLVMTFDMKKTKTTPTIDGRSFLSIYTSMDTIVESEKELGTSKSHQRAENCC